MNHGISAQQKALVVVCHSPYSATEFKSSANVRVTKPKFEVENKIYKALIFNSKI
jgi:hypothetical protein